MVVFGDSAEVVVNPQTAREEAARKIEAIKVGGNTNLSLGWGLGLLELQTYTTDSHYSRLFLLSDGQANAGETKRTTLAREASLSRDLGITTTTIGIGDDFAEDLLEALATASGGRFWYIGESKIEEIIEEEFRGALTVLYDRPRVELDLPRGLSISQEINALRKLGGRYRIRPLKGEDTFNFAIRLLVNPDVINGNEFAVTARLYDGDNHLADGSAIVKLAPATEVATAQSNALVRSVVQQFQITDTSESMLDSMATGQMTLMKRMLVEEVAGMRVVRDQLEAQAEDERALMELRHLDAEGMMSEVSLELIGLLEPFAGDPLVTHFIRTAWRKGWVQGRQRIGMRVHDVGDFDEDVVVTMLAQGIALADELAQRYPDKAEDIAQHRERLRGYLEGL